MADKAVIAVDVGTGSARAALFDENGKMLARATRPIAMHQPHPDHAEQSGEDVWQAVCGAAREAREQAGLPPGERLDRGR
jgi:ribulose kinase